MKHCNLLKKYNVNSSPSPCFFWDLTLLTTKGFWETVTILSGNRYGCKATFKCILMVVVKRVFTAFLEAVWKFWETASVSQNTKKALFNSCSQFAGQKRCSCYLCTCKICENRTVYSHKLRYNRHVSYVYRRYKVFVLSGHPLAIIEKFVDAPTKPNFLLSFVNHFSTFPY